MALAVAHPWASASSYLSSQSLADSRSNLHATRVQYVCEFFWGAAPAQHRLASAPMLARGAKSLRAASLRPAGLRLASGVPARTPEQTEHLEKLAEEHNGFLFGEVVRAARASPDMP